MSPKAIYQIPGDQGDSALCEVRITYFPNMKGMDQANIKRWVSSVTLPSGQPAGSNDAAVEKHQLGAVTITTVDISGTIKAGMRAPTGTPDQRLIAAIMDHPQGPHFIKALGPSGAMAPAAESIMAFIKSAKVSE